MSIWVSGISLTLPVTTVFSRHSDRSIENDTKVHCVSKTDCLVSRLSAVLPDPCLACGKHVADVGVPHQSARWLAEPGGNGRSSGSVYCCWVARHDKSRYCRQKASDNSLHDVFCGFV